METGTFTSLFANIFSRITRKYNELYFIFLNPMKKIVSKNKLK